MSGPGGFSKALSAGGSVDSSRDDNGRNDNSVDSAAGAFDGFVVRDIMFTVGVDPNHCFGSCVKQTDGVSVKTAFNLCSTLVINVENKWVHEYDTKLDARRDFVDTAKSDKYESKFQKSAPQPRGAWSRYHDESLVGGRCPELAWAFPSWNAPFKSIKYTSSLTAGLITLEEATAQRGGRPWGCYKNQEKADSMPGEAYPVIETCGVVLRCGEQVLTFPSLKFASPFATPGGGIDWEETPPPSLDEQMDFAIANCWRELEEEAGLHTTHFSDTAVRKCPCDVAAQLHAVQSHMRYLRTSASGRAAESAVQFQPRFARAVRTNYEVRNNVVQTGMVSNMKKGFQDAVNKGKEMYKEGKEMYKEHKDKKKKEKAVTARMNY